MRPSALFMVACVFLLLGCGESEKKPATSDYEKQFALQLPAYLQLANFDVEASENVGSKVEPFYKARFKATVKLKTKTFEVASQRAEVTLIRPVAEEGETKDIYGVASARLTAGNWRMEFNLENNPIPSMGQPRDFFTGARFIVVGSPEESEFKAQEEQKRLAAEQEEQTVQKARQLQEEKVAAERDRQLRALEAERRLAKIAAEKDAAERERQRLAHEAERREAQKAEEQALRKQQEEEENRAAERERLRFVIVEAIYGTPERSVNVTNVLNNLIQNGRLVTTASNNLAGDPYPHVKKRLTIKYRNNGEFFIKVYEENAQVVLP
jgi:flagellar biosynthesis GTPase FlhF